MNTRFLMTITALVLGITGLAFIFLPSELLYYFNKPETDLIVMQLLGALYFGFSMLNWTAKGNLVGGIYGRPVAMSNFTHFFIGGLSLLKLECKRHNPVLLICSLVYLIFGALFGHVLIKKPTFKNSKVPK